MEDVLVPLEVATRVSLEALQNNSSNSGALSTPQTRQFHIAAQRLTTPPPSLFSPSIDSKDDHFRPKPSPPLRRSTPLPSPLPPLLAPAAVARIPSSPPPPSRPRKNFSKLLSKFIAIVLREFFTEFIAIVLHIVATATTDDAMVTTTVATTTTITLSPPPVSPDCMEDDNGRYSMQCFNDTPSQVYSAMSLRKMLDMEAASADFLVPAFTNIYERLLHFQIVTARASTDWLLTLHLISSFSSSVPREPLAAHQGRKTITRFFEVTPLQVVCSICDQPFAPANGSSHDALCKLCINSYANNKPKTKKQITPTTTADKFTTKTTTTTTTETIVHFDSYTRHEYALIPLRFEHPHDQLAAHTCKSDITADITRATASQTTTPLLLLPSDVCSKDVPPQTKPMVNDEQLILDSVCVEEHPSINASPHTYAEYTLLKELAQPNAYYAFPNVDIDVIS
eukprot:gene14465-15969_t